MNKETHDMAVLDPSGDPSAGAFALRLTFSYSAASISLDSIQVLEGMLSRPSDPLEHEPEAGFWYELRDEQNATLYRKVEHNPMRYDAEIYVEDGAPIVRQEMEGWEGTFTLLIPSLAGAVAIALFSSPLSSQTYGAAAEEFATFSLVDQGGVA
jgi:hypothetical protein